MIVCWVEWSGVERSEGVSGVAMMKLVCACREKAESYLLVIRSRTYGLIHNSTFYSG